MRRRPQTFPKIAALLLCMVTGLAFSACGSRRQTVGSAESGGKMQVSVSFNAMQELTEAVGKDKVEISTINPGVEGCVADFEPKAKDLAGLKTIESTEESKSYFDRMKLNLQEISDSLLQ